MYVKALQNIHDFPLSLSLLIKKQMDVNLYPNPSNLGLGRDKAG